MTEGVFDNWRDNPELPCLARTLQCWPQIASSTEEGSKCWRLCFERAANNAEKDGSDIEMKEQSKDAMEGIEERASLLEHSIEAHGEEMC